MKKYYFIILLCFVLFPFTVHGAMCGDVDRIKHAELANNITYYFDAIEQDGVVKFQVNFYNVDGLKIVDARTSKQYTSNPLAIGNLSANTSYRFLVQATTGGCSGTTIETIYVTTPGYNPYYKDDICKGIESFTLCQRWNQVSLTYDDFISEVTKYKSSSNQEQENPVNKEVKGIYDYIIEFFTNYYYIVLPILIVGGIVLIFWLRKREEFF